MLGDVAAARLAGELLQLAGSSLTCSQSDQSDGLTAAAAAASLSLLLLCSARVGLRARVYTDHNSVHISQRASTCASVTKEYCSGLTLLG